MVNNLVKIFVTLFMLVGALQLSIFIHEGIHVIQFDHPERICYGFGMNESDEVDYKTGAYMYVEGKEHKDSDTRYDELIAYGIESIIFGASLILVYIYVKEEMIK